MEHADDVEHDLSVGIGISFVKGKLFVEIITSRNEKTVKVALGANAARFYALQILRAADAIEEGNASNGRS